MYNMLKIYKWIIILFFITNFFFVPRCKKWLFGSNPQSINQFFFKSVKMTLPLKIVWILCFKRDSSADSGLKARLVICGVLTLEWDLIQCIEYTFSSMALKPINIRWIRTSSQPYCKIMYCIVIQTIIHEY